MDLGPKHALSPAVGGLRGRHTHLYSVEHTSNAERDNYSPMSQAPARQKQSGSVIGMNSNADSHMLISSSSRAKVASKQPPYQERSAKVMRKYSKAGTASIGKMQQSRKYENPNASYPSNYLKSLQSHALLSGNFELTSPKKG